MSICPDCNGRGAHAEGGVLPGEYEYYSCSVCGGTGEVTKEELALYETGQQLEDLQQMLAEAQSDIVRLSRDQESLGHDLGTANGQVVSLRQQLAEERSALNALKTRLEKAEAQAAKYRRAIEEVLRHEESFADMPELYDSHNVQHLRKALLDGRERENV